MSHGSAFRLKHKGELDFTLTPMLLSNMPGSLLRSNWGQRKANVRNMSHAMGTVHYYSKDKERGGGRQEEGGIPAQVFGVAIYLPVPHCV